MQPTRVTPLLVGLLAGVVTASCGARANAPPPAERAMVWRQVGSWSGGGSMQTESFTSDSGVLRVRWETTGTPAEGAADPVVFRVTAHSAISGRLLQPVVEDAAAGHGIAYVQQDPHVFYFVVEARQVNWKFTVEEGIGYP